MLNGAFVLYDLLQLQCFFSAGQLAIWSESSLQFREN